MIKFLLKGVLRDRSRSLLPIIVVAIGVFLTVFMTGWMGGIFSDMIDMNANFTTGHVKVMTRAYNEQKNQLPNDLALLDVSAWLDTLHQEHPDMQWVERIQFGGLLDVPDAQGETRAQGPALGRAVDLLTPGSGEAERLNITQSLVQGRLPQQSGEALISNDFAVQYGVHPGEVVTLFGSSMDGGMVFRTFTVSGTVRFGMAAIDRGAIIVDIRDAQQALAMEDAAGEILGYFNEEGYDDERAAAVAASFNARHSLAGDEFSPLMVRLREQEGLDQYLAMADNMAALMVFIFVMAMSVVLWNTGLLGSLRRYNEYGVRLALGEQKRRIFGSILLEAVMIGLIGSVLGSLLGVGLSYYLQENGLDFSGLMKNITMMMPTVYRARVTPLLFYIGFVPGLVAMVLGNALAGAGIFRRKTATLFKELEV